MAKHFFKNYFSLALSLLYFLVLGLLFVDSFKSSNTVAKYLVFSSEIYLGGFIVLNFVLRLFKNIKLSALVTQINQITVLLASGLTCVILTIVDYFTPPNFVFDRLLLNYQHLGVIAVGSLALALINSDLRWLRKRFEILIFLSGVLILAILGLIRLWPNDVFLNAVKEDAFIENFQFLVLLLSSLVSLLIAFKTARLNKLVSVLYLFAGLGLFFVAGDEISWGQRILQISTPENLTAINDQSETNFHNLFFFNKLVGFVYMVIGFYGAFAWIIQKFVGKSLWDRVLSWIVPPKNLSVFFLSGFLYNLAAFFAYTPSFGEWAEPAELMLHLGVLIFVSLNFMRLTFFRLPE